MDGQYARAHPFILLCYFYLCAFSYCPLRRLGEVAFGDLTFQTVGGCIKKRKKRGVRDNPTPSGVTYSID